MNKITTKEEMEAEWYKKGNWTYWNYDVRSSQLKTRLVKVLEDLDKLEVRAEFSNYTPLIALASNKKK